MGCGHSVRATTAAGADLVGLLDGLSSVLTGLDGLDLQALTVPEIADGVIALQRILDRGAVVLAGFVSAADAAAVWAGSGNRGIAGWLAERSKAGFGRAAELTKLADVLDASSAVARRVRDGEMSTATAVALAPMVLAPPPGATAEDVEVLVDSCVEVDPKQARVAVEAWRADHDARDEAEVAARRFARRALRFGFPVDGMVSISGQLPSFEAGVVRKAVIAFGGGRPDADDTRSSEQRNADGLLRLVRDAAVRDRDRRRPSTPRSGVADVSGRSGSSGARAESTGQADPVPGSGPDGSLFDPVAGVGGVPSGDLGGELDGDAAPGAGDDSASDGDVGGEYRPPGGTQAATLLVTIPIGVLTGTSDGPGWDEFDTPVPGVVARAVAAHAGPGDLVPVLHDGTVVLAVGATTDLDLGRRSRLRSPAQYVALLVRDGHCRWPGCTAPASWCEVDHAVPWLRGGKTDLRNLWLLCAAHHAEKHRAGTIVTGTTDGPVTITLPNGTVITSRPSGPITRCGDTSADSGIGPRGDQATPDGGSDPSCLPDVGPPSAA